MSSFRYVIDTNVLVSAALFKRSIPRQAFDQAFAKGKILLSTPVINELQNVFRRSRFDKYSSPEARLAFLTDLLQFSEIVEIKTAIAICRDPKDNKFLELAVNGKADYIISGDQDLLVLHPFRDISIVSPASFLG
jgi:uncharacterized protein